MVFFCLFECWYNTTMFMKKNKGFTIVELMVVVGLIAILLAIVLSNLGDNRAAARDNVRVADIQTIRLALDEYRAVCGVYPATLSLTGNVDRSGSVCNVQLEDLLGQIPTVPVYSNGNTEYLDDHGFSESARTQYLYTGLSNVLNGPCYDYHIGVQLERGSDNDYNDGKNQQRLSEDHDYVESSGKYTRTCGGSGPHIENADDDTYGVYDFRSTRAD
jgi:prepilin-type N-terminal cleavage/methylation domain-containing protein